MNLVEKLAGYFRGFNPDARSFQLSPPADPMLAEISAMERTFARQLTLVRGHRATLLQPEPVTKVEKILDLSG